MSEIYPKPYPRVEQVILTKEPRGKGIEGDPYRIVTVVTSVDGTFIAENDPMPIDLSKETP